MNAREPNGGEPWDAELFRLLVDTVEEHAIFIMDAERRVLRWSYGAERLFGYSESEILGQPVDCLFTPADRNDGIPQRETATALATGSAGDDRWHVRKDGSRLWCAGAVSVLEDGAGHVRGLVKIVRDLTRLKRQEALRSARLAVAQTLAAATTIEEAAPGILHAVCAALEWDAGILWLVDQEAGVLRCRDVWHGDAAFTEFSDVSRRTELSPGQGLAGRVWSSGQPAWVPDVTPDDDGPRARVAEQAGFHGAFAAPIVGSAGVLGAVEFLKRPVQAPDADLLDAMAGVGVQIGQFVERAWAQEALRESDRRKDEFLAMLAHELRNPLAPIRSGLDLMGMDAADEETVEVMKQQVEHLVRLVDDLLDVARIMRGRIELRMEPLELATVVTRAVEISRPMIEARRHRLTGSLPPEPVWISGDPVRLVQVLDNLLNNAAKYTETGGNLWITMEHTADEAVLRVRDDGIGIGPDLLPNVFDIFCQAERSADRSQGGLGIGLTLVRRLVEMHGGTVTASSEGPGKGSEFTVRLPTIAPPRKQPAQRAAPAVVRPRRILIVDDNAGAAKLLGLLLSKTGDHRIETAHDGAAAIEAAERFLPDLMLLDIGLPRMDGYEVARRLRARPEFDRMFLVALTGYGTDEDRRLSEEAGVDEHLVKPPSLDMLKSLLHHPKLTGRDT